MECRTLWGGPHTQSVEADDTTHNKQCMDLRMSWQAEADTVHSVGEMATDVKS